MAKKTGKAAVKTQKSVKSPARLPNVYVIAKIATQTLWQHKKLFGGIILAYGLLNLVFVQGLTGGNDVSSLKQNVDQAFTGQFAAAATGLSVFAVLVGSAGNASSQTAGAYQVFLGLIGSLAIIWALRQTLAGTKIRIRDSFYKGMYPLVPFILVLLVIGLQLIPLLIGSALYSLVISNGIAVAAAEKLVWLLLYAALAALTLYMLGSSLFALYIVTLPDMTPIKALRSAKELVRGRRWTVLRKIICLPIILLLVAAIIMVPIIALLAPLAQWIFFLISMFALLAVHAYMYTLYRELLNE